MTRLAIGRENLLAAIVRRKFRSLFSALRSGNFFHRGHFASVRVKRFTAKISRVAAEICATKKYGKSVHCDQPDGKRLAAHTWLTLFALHRGMNVLHISDFAVIHPLARRRLWCWCALVHFAGCPPGAGGGEAAGDAVGAAPADLTSFKACD